MTLPETTCSTWSGSSLARSMAWRATVAPSSVGGTSRRLRPKEAMAVRGAEAMTTSFTTCFLFAIGAQRKSDRAIKDATNKYPGREAQREPCVRRQGTSRRRCRRRAHASMRLMNCDSLAWIGGLDTVRTDRTAAAGGDGANAALAESTTNGTAASAEAARHAASALAPEAGALVDLDPALFGRALARAAAGAMRRWLRLVSTVPST
jgi:hypothetical protein